MNISGRATGATRVRSSRFTSSGILLRTHKSGFPRGEAADLCKMFLLRCGVQELDPGTLKNIAQTSTAPVASGDDV